MEKPAVTDLAHVPGGWAVVTAMAMGYGVTGGELPEALKKSELAPRQRNAATSFVFKCDFGVRDLYPID